MDRVADRLAELSLTDWWPVRVGLIALVVLLVVAAVWRARRWYTRTLLAVLAVVAVVANVLAGVNAYYGYYLTLGQAVGLPGRDGASLAQLDRHAVPATGVVVGIDIPGSRSRFAARPAQIYLPPVWFTRPRPRLPVLVLLHGSPGAPTDWIDGGMAEQTLDDWAATHRGRTPIVVMPDVNGSLTGDTECVDSPAGNAETYLARDLPDFVHSRFFTLAPGRSWAVAGLSEGGMCSLMLALRHPDVFGTFGDYSGLLGPRIGSTNALGATVRVLFHGSRHDFDLHEPSFLLAHGHYRRLLAGWFEVGALDTGPYHAERALAAQATRVGIPNRLVVVPGETHTFTLWREAFAASLPWLDSRLLGMNAVPVRGEHG